MHMLISAVFSLVALAAAVPVADGDRDGVVDNHDECPDSDRGAPVTMRGCAYDADADGVPDYRDDCPASPAERDTDAYGCPVAHEIALDGVRFEVNSATLRPESEAALAAAAALLRAYVGLRAEIAGHTDDRGSATHNQRLSRKRAEAVRAWLVAAGLDPATLSARGYGEGRPAASNSTEAGRAANRRVVLRILEGDPVAAP